MRDLLQGYAVNHSETFNNTKINSEYLGGLKPFESDEYSQYYKDNFALTSGALSGAGTGAILGIGDQIANMAKGLYGLGQGLVTDPEQTALAVLHGVASTNPLDGYREAMGLAELYRLQGDNDAAARVEMEWRTGFAMNLVIAGRAGATSEALAAELRKQRAADWMASDLGPCCFAAGTLVATPDGDRAIETLKVGDIVWSKPEHGGKPFAAAILQTHQRNDQPIYKLTLESTRSDGEVRQETLFVTPSHPFYVPARRDFVPMIELRMGDLLQSLGDGATENTSSRVAGVELFKPVGQTYNLTVDIGHTFYVGELKTWVHNTGPCKLPVKSGEMGEPSGRDIAATSVIAKEGLKNDLASQAGIPLNIYADPASIWGKSIEDIKQFYVMNGATLSPSTKAGTSGNSKAFKIEGFASGVIEVQYSPSTVGEIKQSTHVGEYYKITYSDGSKVKVIDSLSYRPTFQGDGMPQYDNGTKYLNSSGEEVFFDKRSNIWVPR